MTQDEIIEMAREALTQKPREDWNSNAWVFSDETLQAFSNLVAAKEREALAQPEQEPVHNVQSNGRHSPLLTHMMNKQATPPQRTEQLKACVYCSQLVMEKKK